MAEVQFFCFFLMTVLHSWTKPFECFFFFVPVSCMSRGVPGKEMRQRVVQQKHFLALFSWKLLILFSEVDWGALDGCSILATTDKVLEVQPNIPQLSLHSADDGLVFSSHVVCRKLTHAYLYLLFSFLFFLLLLLSSLCPVLSLPPFYVDFTPLSFSSYLYFVSQFFSQRYVMPTGKGYREYFF